MNNTNLARMANADDLRDGYEVIREASERSGVPVLYTTGRRICSSSSWPRARPEVHRHPMPIETYAPRLGDVHQARPEGRAKCDVLGRKGSRGAGYN